MLPLINGQARFVGWMYHNSASSSPPFPPSWLFHLKLRTDAQEIRGAGCLAAFAANAILDWDYHQMVTPKGYTSCAVGSSKQTNSIEVFSVSWKNHPLTSWYGNGGNRAGWLGLGSAWRLIQLRKLWVSAGYRILKEDTLGGCICV